MLSNSEFNREVIKKISLALGEMNERVIFVGGATIGLYVEDDVVCRFRYDNIKVDVMSTKEVGWAPANPWFSQGFAQRETVQLGDQSIQLLPLTYFIASKFAAHKGRGGKDPRTSHDFEDIVYVIDNRIDITEQIKKAPNDVKSYLMEQLGLILKDNALQEAILGNLAYDTREARYDRIIQCIDQITRLD